MSAVHALADTLVLEVVRFRCGPWHLALPARDVRGGYRLAPGEVALPIETLLPAADSCADQGSAASTAASDHRHTGIEAPKRLYRPAVWHVMR